MAAKMNRPASRNDFRRALPMLEQVSFGKYCPSIVGLVGSDRMVKQLLQQIQTAIWNRNIDSRLKDRLDNMLCQYIPQIANSNGMKFEELQQIPDKVTLEEFFRNATLEKKLPGENVVFLRVIYHSLKTFLESVS
ncbi:MAG TPA: hypothetical protein VF817_02530 [Patescibacteria group bacterium]